MKLQDIWNSAAAWRALSPVKKSPKVAYLLLKYENKVQAEVTVCEKQKNALIYELAGVPAPTGNDVVLVDISGDADKMSQLQARFAEFLQTESELPQAALTMDALVESLSSDMGVLTEHDLQQLEPFFKA